MMLLWMVLITFSFLKIQLTSGSRFSSADCNGEPENEAFSEFWLHSTAPTAVASDINGQCIAHTREYLAAYRSRSSWAVKSKFTSHLSNLYASPNTAHFMMQLIVLKSHVLLVI